MEVLPRLLLGAACAMHFAYGCGSSFSGADGAQGGAGGAATTGGGKGGKASTSDPGGGGDDDGSGGDSPAGGDGGGDDVVGGSGMGAVAGSGGAPTVESCVVDPDGDGSCVGSIAAGAFSTCALRGAGEVRCWGSNANARLGDGLTSHESCGAEDCSPVPVSVLGVSDGRFLLGGENTFCTTNAEHALLCWGWDVTNGTDIGLGTVEQFGDFVVQAASLRFALGAIDQQGQIWMGGYDDDGRGIFGDGASEPGALRDLAPIPGLSGALALDVGWFHSCAVLASKAVACWGVGESGEIGDGETLDRSSPAPVIGLEGQPALAVAVGDAVSCALIQGGSVWCWGSNDRGQLGSGQEAPSAEPVEVEGLADAVEIDAGFRHVCARRATGHVVCWGADQYGQLGDMESHASCTQAVTGPCSLAPVEVSDLDDAVAISAGRQHSCALRATGDVVCWGQNNYGQLGNGTFDNAATPVTVSEL